MSGELSKSQTSFICKTTCSQALLTFCLQLIQTRRMKHYARGLQNYKLGKLNAALKDFSKAITEDPYHKDAYTERGKVYHDLKKFNEAAADYTEVIKMEPLNAAIYKKRGGVFLAMKKYPEAIADYTESLRLNPKNPKAYHNRGLALYYLRRYDEAIEDLTSALKLDPRNVHIYNNRGNAYNDIKRHQEALEDLSKAIIIDPKSFLSYYHRGNVHTMMKQYNLAISDYSQALSIDPKFVRAYNKRGVVYTKLKNYELALVDYDSAIKHDPKFPFAYSNRGNVFCLLKNYSEAEYDFHTALNLLPNSPVYLLNLANCYLELNEMFKAKSFFNEGVDSFTSNKEHVLKQKFRLADRHITFLKGMIEEYKQVKTDVLDAMNWASVQERSDVEGELKRLGDIYQNLAIRNAAEVSKEETVKEELLRKVAETKGKIMNLHKEVKDKEEEKMQTKKRIESQYRRKIKFEKKVNDEVEKIKDFYNKRKNKVHTLDKTILKIRALSQNQVQRYFTLLYHIIINHLTAYKIVSTQFFSKNARKFLQTDDFLEQLCLSQPIVEQMPELKSLVVIPFRLLKKYREVRALHLSIFISKKLSDSSLNDQTQITHFIAYLIEQLVDSQEYIHEIGQAIEEKEDGYIKKLSETITADKACVSSNLFDSEGQQLTYLDSVVVGHLTLITRKLYEVPILEFKRASQDKKMFSNMIIECIPLPTTPVSLRHFTDNATKKLIPLESEGAIKTGAPQDNKKLKVRTLKDLDQKKGDRRRKNEIEACCSCKIY